MARKITFRRVKLQQEKRKFEFTWDKILLLVLLGALILFYSLTTIFNDEIDSIGRAISEQTEQEQETESIATIRAVIEVENASHLDSGKTFIADITNEVKKLDGIWSEEISDGEYIKVTFEQLLTSNHDITIYPRIVSGSPKIEVYETGGTEIIAEFTSINSNQYNKIFLDGSSGAGLGDRIQDTFDLRVVGGSIEVEHIIDPETWYARSDSSGLSNCITLNNAFSQTAGGTATSIAMGTANEPSCWYTPARSATIDTGIWEAFVEFTTTGTGQGSPASFTVDITFSNGTIKESIASCTTGNNPTGELNCTVSGVPQKTLSNDRIRLSVQKDAGARTINVHYNGSAGGSSDTRIIFPNAVVTDAESPKWQNNQTNSTEAGEPVEHSVNWTDDTALSGYIFEFDNGNGSFFNDSFVTFTGTQNFSNVTKVVNSTAGSTNRRRVFANDTSNNLNSTDIFTYVTTDETPPKWFDNQTNSTEAGEPVEHSVNWTDDTALSGYIFEFDNGNGSFFNDSFVTFTGTQNFSNVTKIVNSTAGSTIRWRVFANDTSNNLNSTDIFTYVTTDETPPKWFDNQTNSTEAGEPVEHSVNWTDDTALSGYIFEFDNGNGSFFNDSFVTFTGTQNFSNVTKIVNSTAGSTIRWRVFANDSSNNLNNTPIFSYVTTEDTPPQWSNANVNDSTPDPNQIINHQVTWTDDTALSYATLEVNGTGPDCDALGNVSSKLITGTTNVTNLTWVVQNACEGKAVGWRMYANDSANQWNVTDTQEYTVNNIDPLASFGTNQIDFYNSSSGTVFFELKGSDNLGVSFLRLYANFSGSWTFNQTNTTPVNDTIWNVTVAGISEGKYVWAAWVNDTSVNGNQDFTDTNRTLTVDLTAPTSTINAPANNTNTTDNTPDINITLTDNFDPEITYNIYVDHVINKTGSLPNNTATNVTLDQQPDGTHSIIVEATDDVGRKTNSSLIFITIDATVPLIQFVAPTPANATVTQNTSVTINTTITELNLERVIFNWNTTNYTVYNDSLVLLLNFDNISAIGDNDTLAVDASNWGNNATLVNGSTYANSKFIKALSLDGTDDFARVPQDAELNITDEITIEFWINTNETRLDADTPQREVVFRKGSNVIFGYEFATSQVFTRFFISYSNGSTQEAEVLDSNAPTRDGKWHHLAASFKANDTMKLYIDGIMVDNETVNHVLGIRLSGTNNDYIIGARETAAGAIDRNINASVDGVKIWNRALTPEELNESYYTNIYKYTASNWAVNINQSMPNFGTYTYYSFAEDNFGNVNQTETRTIKRNDLRVTILYPAENEQYIDVTTMNFTITNSSTLDKCWYALNSSFTNVTTSCTANITGLTSTEGSNTWYVFANDTIGVENFDSVTFIKDTTNPSSVFVSPTPANGTATSNRFVQINTSITEINLEKVIFNWNTTNYTVYNDSLVLFLNFDNISAIGDNDTLAVDVSRYGNNGTLVNGSTYTSGKYLNALKLDGTDDFVRVTEDTELNVQNETTIEFWINSNDTRFNETTAQREVIFRKGSNLIFGYENETPVDNRTSLRLFIRYENDSTQAVQMFEPDNGFTRDGEWHHVAATFQRNVSLILYVDGIAKDSETPVASGGIKLSSINNDYIIGAREQTDGTIDRNLNASLDSVKIWNRSLSASEINQSYFSNLYKYNSTSWILYVNQSKSPNSTLDEGTYTYFTYDEDIAGNTNQTETRTIIVDTTKPNVQFVAPTTETGNFSQNFIQANVTATDTNLDTITIRIYNSTDLVNSSSDTTSPHFFNFTSLADGNYFLNATANDTAGNENQTETRNITLDTTPPQIQFVAPTEANGTSFSRTWIFANVTITEPNFQNVSFKLFNSTGLLNWTNFTDSTREINFTGLSNDGVLYWYNVSSYDTFGQFNETETRYITLTQDQPPVVDILYPQNITYNVNVSELNYTATDESLSHCWYSLDGGTTNSTPDSACPNFTGLTSTENSNTWTVYANDSINQISSDSVTFFKDTINPLIQFENPTEANNTNFSRTWIFVNVSITEANFQNVTFSLYFGNGTENNVTTFTDSTREINFTGLADGTYLYNVTTFDTASNKNNTETRLTRLDTTAPATTFVAPTEDSGVNRSRNYIEINVTATDSFIGLDKIVIRLFYSNGTQLNSSTTSISPNFANFTGLADGLYFYNATANDTVGNVNNTETRNITLDTTAPTMNYVAPTENSGVFRSQNFIDVNVTATDSLVGLSVITIRLYNSTNHEIRINTSTTSPFNITYTGLANGIYYYNSTANDTVNNVANLETRNITLDTVNPSVFYNPSTDADGIFVNRNWVFVNITASDTNRDTVLFQFDGANETFENDTFTNLFWENKTSLSEGAHSFFASVNDSAGNVNSTATRTVTVDTIIPTIEFAPPTEANDSQLTRNFIQVNVTASDTNLGTITLSLYNSTGLVQTNTSTESPLFVNFTNLADENYKFNATVNDSAGNTNETETIFVTTDTGAPTINYEAPTETNNTFLNRNFIRVNVTAGDPNLDKILVSLFHSNGTPAGSNATSTSPNFANFTSLVDGQYKFNASANDTFGNTANLGTRNVTLDTVQPSITNIDESPADGVTYVSGATYRFNATIADTNLDTVLIEFDGTNYTPSSTFGGGIYNFTISDLAAGVHNYYWWANDSAANVNTSVQTYTINNATGNVTLLINDSAENQTAVYGTQTNASASTLFGSVTLFRNGTDVTSQNNAFVTLAVGFYNYTAVSSGDGNHSSASTSLFVTINKATSVVNLTLNGTDGNVTIIQESSIFLNLTTITGDSGATLRLYNDGTLWNQGTSPLSNLTAFNDVGVFNITGFYIDSENYTGSFETWYVNVTETPDVTAPSVTNLTERPSDPANYSPGATYEFNATVTEARIISVVRIDFNGINYSVTNFSGNVYNFTISDLAVGTYNYRWYANDTAGNMNGTQNGTYTINQNTTNLTLTITPSTTVTYPTETTATGSGCPSQITCTLYRNGVDVGSSTDVKTLAAATYNYTYNTTGNANYTADSETTNLTVNQNAGACNVFFNATSPLTYPDAFTASTDCTSAFTLSRNGTTITNGSQQLLSASAYNFSVQRTDTENYTNTFDQEEFIINKGTGNVSTHVDNKRENITIGVNSEIYLNGTLVTGTGNISLYINNSLNQTGVSPLSAFHNFSTVGLYNISTLYDGNENYTSDFETWFVNVSELDLTPPSITILHPQNISYNSVRTQLNYTATDGFGLSACWYSLDSGTTNSTPDTTCSNFTGLTSTENSNTWTVYANDTSGNENSSSVTFFVDTVIPNAQFVAPTEGSGVFRSQSFIDVNVTASDANLEKIVIRLFNSTLSQIRTNESATSPFNITYSSLADGIYYYNSTANDTAGNTNNTETRNITLDTVNPSIAYNADTDADGIFVNRNWVFINITASDTNRDTVKLSFDGTNQSFTNNDGNFYWENKTSLSDGAHSFFAWVNDSANNVNSTATRTVTVDTTNPTVTFVNITETNGTRLGRNYIQVNVTASDEDLENITIRLFNSTGSQIRINVSTSPFPINYTGLTEGNYSFNATANDSIGNTANTETRTVSLERPSLTILRPENETYFNNISLQLNFSVELQDEIRYNIDNTTNTTITGNTTFNTTEGSHTLYLFANNTLGTTSKNISFTINISTFKVIYDNYKSNGSTTEFNASSYEDIQNLSGAVLERTSHGKIVFNENINLTNDSDTSDNTLDLDSNTNISANFIEINTTALPNFNKSATLSLYGLTFTDPRVLRDGEVCPSTICTEVSYSGGTFIFNVTQFTNYSAEETPGAAAPPADGGGPSEGGGLRQCADDNDCNEFESCVNGLCIKLFDIKILDFETPARLGDFFDFTYFIKSVTTINNDVVISFWIENQAGERITSGSDTIYIGGFGEERTEASKIFLPSTFESGIYSFVIEVSYEGYSARSQRTIEVQVKEGGITITPIDLGGIKTFIIAFLVLLAIITLALVIYRERKKIKRDIEIGLAYETRLFRRFIRHKTSILTFFLIVIVGLLVYLTRFYEFLALKLSEAILWFKIHPAYITYVYYVILGLIFLILLISVLRSKGIREKFHEWKRKRSVGKFFEKKYSAGVREAEKSSRAMEIPERKTNKAFKNLKKGISGFFSALGHWIKKIYEKIMYIPEKKIPLENKLFSKAPYFSQELRKDTSELTEEARAVGREAISEIKEVGKGVRKIEGRVVSEIGEVGKGAQRAVRGSERGVSGFFSDFSHAIKKSGENIIGFFSRVMEIPEKKVPLKSGLFSKAPYFSQELEKDTSDSVEGIKIIGKEISKAASEIEEIPRELGRKEHLFVLREKRNLREETSIVQRSRKVIDGMYNDVASLLSKAFGRRTRRIVVGDFEKHFNKNNRKIARRHRETLRDIIRLEEVSKKKIVGISHEFEAEIHRTRRKAALLIHDLIDYIENNELISSKKEKKELEQRARTYGKEISFVRRISRKASEKVGRLFRRGGREAGRGVRAVEKETGREIGAVKREIPKEMKEVGHFIAEEKKKIGGLFRRQTEEAGKGAGREIREASKEVKVAGHFVGEGKREIQRETENLVQKSGRIVNQIYDDTAGLLSKAFGKRTRKIVAEDFERHFRKHDEKIARRHEKTIKDIIRLKEAFAKKKIAGISREFGEEVHNTREKAAELIYDLVNHLENSNLISSAKERKRVEKKAKMYEHELSFMKRLPEKIGGFFKRIKSEIPKQKKSEFKNPFSINIGKNVFKTNKNQGFKNPFEMHGKEKRHVRKPW